MGYPETSEDTVIYGEKNFYVDSDAFVGMLDGTTLDIWGNVNINGESVISIAPAGGSIDDGALITSKLAGGRNVTLGPGIYNISSTIVLPSGSSLIGSRTATLKANSLLVGQVIRNSNNLDGNNNILLQGFIVDANRAERITEINSAIYIGISLELGGTGYCDKITIRNVEIKESNRLGLMFSRVRDSNISYNLVHDNTRDGITFYYDCSDVVVHGNRVYNVRDDMIGCNAENGVTVGHPMKRMSIIGNILGGGEISQTAGSNIALSGVQDSVISSNICRDGFAAGITVSNWNTTPSKRLIISNNFITTPGRNQSITDGIGIIVVGARTVSSTAGKAGCEDIVLIGNIIEDARYIGIRALSQTDGLVSGLKISNCIIKNSGHTASSQPAIQANDINDLQIIDNRCYDDQTPKTQNYGLVIDAPLGNFVLSGNDFNNNFTSRVAATNMVNLTQSTIDNNPGYVPREGIVSAAGTWTSIAVGVATAYYKNLTVTFSVPWPTGITPIISATSTHSGIGCSVVTPTNTGFTARLFAYGDPGTGTHSAHWTAHI